MLYQLHECYRAWLDPLSEWSFQMAQSLQHNPPVWAHPSMAAGLQLFHRLAKDYPKPAWDITHSINDAGESVPIEIQTVIHQPFCDLLHFAKIGRNPTEQAQIDQQPKLLICAPLSGHHATLLHDTIKALLPHHQVFITDWLDARFIPLSDGAFDLDDYVYYLMDFFAHLGAENLHVLSVCQPTVPVLGAASLMAAHGLLTPKSLILMGGPIDGRKNPTSVNQLAVEKDLNWFKDNLIYSVPADYAGHGRRVYPGFLQYAGFISMNVSRHMQSHWDYYLHLLQGDDEDAQTHIRFYDQYNAVLDMTEEYYLQTIEVVFQKFSLATGNWWIRGEHVQPGKIHQSALLTIEGELDDISGIGQTFAAHDLCPNIAQKTHMEIEGAGHYGIFSGRRWRNQVAPKIRQFIAQQG